MNLMFQEVLPSQESLLMTWLLSEEWPYFIHSQPNPEFIRNMIEKGHFYGKESKSFWIILDGNEKVGLVTLHDLLDPTPMFDIRLRTRWRGKGIGKKAVKWLTDYIFSTMPDKIRIEANTRQDNIAMRHVFLKCGYVKEAHYRKAWPIENGKYTDAIGYGVTREDWAEQKVTPVDWNDQL